jgi:hypothetical protein
MLNKKNRSGYPLSSAHTVSGWIIVFFTVPDPQSTYICRVQSCFWPLPKYSPPTPPLHPASVSSPPHQRRGGTDARRAVRGVNILEDARHRIGLLQYNLSTARPVSLLVLVVEGHDASGQVEGEREQEQDQAGEHSLRDLPTQ